MRAPLSWLREHVELPADLTGRAAAEALIRVGFEVERVESYGADLTGVVVGEVLEVEELTEFKKPIRFCQVRVAEGAEPRGIVCGARNFQAGDKVAVALPGVVLPGDFVISARTTYGRVSDGMICSERELGIGDDHAGILVLPPDLPVGADVVEALGLRDEVLDIAVTPDRGYALSVRGLARELAGALGAPFSDPVAPVAAAGPEAWPVTVADAADCSTYVAALLDGVDGQRPSPPWLQQRLRLAGMRPVSVAVDVTNHVMLEWGQPLHAFDADRLTGAVVVRRATAGESLRTLDGVDRVLDPADLVIADDSGPIALAGVMGGAATEIGPATRRVLVESARFTPAVVAGTARRHKLPSEASRRFERGVDTELQAAACEEAARLLVELAGATRVEGRTDVGAPPPRPVIELPQSLPQRTAGRAYAPEAVRQRLVDTGCSVQGEDPLEVVAPSWRPDLVHAHDLVEEVLRLEGLDAIPSALPPVPAGEGLTRAQRVRRAVERAVAGAGLVETLSYPFLSDDALVALGCPDDDPRRQLTRVANPLSDDEPALRTTLLPGLLQTLLRNAGRGAADVALFEVGQVVIDPPVTVVSAPPVDARPSPELLGELAAALPLQPTYLAAVLSGQRLRGGWWGPGRPVTWADAVEVARVAARAARADLQVVQSANPPWHPGRCAGLLLANALIGYAGELHPRVVAALGLPERTVALELDLGALIAAGAEVTDAPQVSAFPPAHVDVALLVDVAVPQAQVHRALAAGAGELLEGLRLFDVYTGPQVGEGRRSLAYSLSLRAPDRTLTDTEILEARDRAVAEAARRTGAVLRGA